MTHILNPPFQSPRFLMSPHYFEYNNSMPQALSLPTTPNPSRSGNLDKKKPEFYQMKKSKQIEEERGLPVFESYYTVK